MATKHILQVSELTKKVKFMLESELNTVWLCGEISNFIAASSGHWYLSLKDAKSQVKCAMFKGKNQRTRITPKNGQQVLVRAKVSLYEPRGDFQIIIELMEEAGEGLLKQQYEQLKQKLNALGLFAQQFKQQIPKHITRVGLVTSPTGAAVKDIISVLKRRNSSIQIVIYPAVVQGEQAKFDIVRAIDQANAREECDVLIVGRGGGSLEDLWPFNEEDVVEAIFHSKIPTISAVGHEIDTTLSDYVADLRAPTPSAAAELVSQDLSETLTQLTVLSQRVQQNIHQTLSNKQQVMQSLQHRLSQVHPEQKLQVYQQKADELAIRLEQALKREIQRFKVIPMHLTKRLTLLSPLQGILHKHEIVQQQRQQLIHAMQQILARKSENFVHLIEQLNIVSPLATIARGYSVSRSKSGIIRSVHQIELDEKINIQVKDGIIEANVVSINDQK
ncbi:exodeoxyribonuclease VII large subunit [Thalassotalea sp. SU-HH00458]|uniref:exodeoxyribonuclease VII large subunit n=1 Tax=Thalassotalea sp. SU-HH00458 TaxID=3127657 RepID=UPI003107727B